MSTAILQNEKKKMLVPQLRFEGFEGEWTVNKLGNYCNFSQGVQVDLELQLQEPKDGYTRFIRIENYTQKSNDFRYIPNKLTNKKSIDENEIAVVRYGATAGYIGRGLKGVLANNLFKVLPNIEILNTSYLFEFLNGYKAFSFFQTEMSGGAMPALSFGIVNALTISFPALPEQQKIASFLSAVDEKIQQLSRKKELLEQYKKGVMQQLFSGKLRFKDENGKDYADWEERKLGEVGKIITGSTPPTSNFEYYNGNQLFVSPADINGARYVLNTKTTLTDLGFEKGRKLIKGTVLFVCIGSTIGKVAIAGFDCITNQQINAIEANSFNSNDFIFSLLELNAINIKLLAGVQAVPQINKTAFSNFKFMFPSLPEQQKIAAFLSSIDAKIESTNQQINQTQSFKKGLLQQLFV